MVKSDLPRIFLLGGDGGYSGVPTYLKQTCEALAGRARISLITDRNEGGYDFAARSEVVGHHVIEGLKTRHAIRAVRHAAQRLDYLIETERPDLVWAHVRMSWIILRWVILRRQYRGEWCPKILLTYHGLPFGVGHRRLVSWISLRIEKAFTSRMPPHYLHFLTFAARQEFQQRLGKALVSRHSTYVFSNCSRIGPLSNGERKRAGPPVVMMASRAGYQKNLEGAADIFKALPRHYRLIICGEGTDHSYCRRIFERAGIDVFKRVQFAGAVPDLRPFFGCADIFLMTSRYEGMPISALEAFEAGIPVALNNVEGMEEILTTHPMATRIEVSDSVGAARKIVDAVDRYRADPEHARIKIQRAWAAHFPFDVWADKLCIVLNRILPEFRFGSAG